MNRPKANATARAAALSEPASFASEGCDEQQVAISKEHQSGSVAKSGDCGRFAPSSLEGQSVSVLNHGRLAGIVPLLPQVQLRQFGRGLDSLAGSEAC